MLWNLKQSVKKVTVFSKLKPGNSCVSLILCKPNFNIRAFEPEPCHVLPPAKHSFVFKLTINLVIELKIERCLPSMMELEILK